MKNKLYLKLLLICACLAACAVTANAQATRTWVSGVGDDANPCSRTAPCKTFAGAISKTANGGEIDALDPGGFGAVTATKSILIDGTGTLAGILSSGINGVTVNITTAAPAGQTTTFFILRNVSINGAGTTLGTNGINYLLGGRLNVLNCLILNVSGDGIHYSMSSNSDSLVRDTVFKNCNSDAIEISTSSGAAKLSLDHSSLVDSGNGLHAKGNSRVIARNCVFSNNTVNGIFSDSPTAGQFSGVSVWESEISLNAANGVRAGNAGNVGASGATLAQNQIDRNGANGVLVSTGGAVETFVNNSIRGNVTDGCPGCTPVNPGN
jgi:hypothetical protein